MNPNKDYILQSHVWDVAVLDKMGAKAKMETLKAWDWLARYPSLSLKFVTKAKNRHPSLWYSEVMSILEDEIRLRSDDAIRLGCLFIADDPKTPFGKIHKRKILKLLKSHVDVIPGELRDRIRIIPDKFEDKPYKPQEYGDLIKLIEAFDIDAIRRRDA